MAELVRAATLTGYFPAMQALGVDPTPLLKEVGLTKAMLENPEQLISAIAAFRLVERSAAVTGCMTLGLRMAADRPLSNLGASSLIIAHQPTLRQALDVLAEYRSRINSTLMLHFEPMGSQVLLREDFSIPQPEPHRQCSNLALGVLMRMCADFLGEHWQPQGACFAHAAPPAADIPVFVRMFRCKPQFDCDFNGLILNQEELDRRNPKADTQLASHARQLLGSVSGSGKRSVSQDVEHLIKLLLPSGRATIQTCAASMGTTVRTLQRQLDAEEESFSDLLNRARKQLAVDHLSNPHMRITDVAIMLGYSSLSAFTRWHSMAFGKSPRQVRADKG